MSPRYITIHSTQNYGAGADARTHARLLQRGRLTSKGNSLGYLTWHFSVDNHSIYQSLPTNEQGQHADYNGRPSFRKFKATFKNQSLTYRRLHLGVEKLPTVKPDTLDQPEKEHTNHHEGS